MACNSELVEKYNSSENVSIITIKNSQYSRNEHISKIMRYGFI